jgi:2-polyprenyl-3-methyl-5-hydroxy-6-metoxy-1,4-benzoquinol methylase
LRRLDRFIQRRRFAKAGEFIGHDVRLLDIGSADGALFKWLGPRVRRGVGVDPSPAAASAGPNCVVLEGSVPDLRLDEQFDVVTLLAVIEHVPREEQKALALECARVLVPNGRVIVTTPSPAADRVLDALRAVRLIDGIELDQHYGLEPDEVPAVFSSAGLSLVHRARFELGFNNLFVFEKRL